ncbi:hypothetical protein C8N25_1021, partial [Algoriphagus antarcticus]
TTYGYSRVSTLGKKEIKTISLGAEKFVILARKMNDYSPLI